MATPTTLISPLLWQGIPFEDPDAWDDFLGFHDQWHIVIVKTISVLGGNVKRINLDDLKTQGTYHQQMHDAIADFLQIPRGGDIASANLEDKSEFINWQFVHALDHQRFRIALGI